MLIPESLRDHLGSSDIRTSAPSSLSFLAEMFFTLLNVLTVSFLQDYIKDPDRRFAADTVAAIGLCAKRLPEIPTACLNGLLALVKQGMLCFISIALIS